MISYIYLIYPFYFMLLNYILPDNIPHFLSTKEKFITSFNATLNCVMTILVSSSYFLNETDINRKIVFYYGTSYYIWDLFRIVLQKDVKNYFYIYHHYVTILMLENIYLNNESRIINQIFLIGEISNISYHTVANLLKFKNKKHLWVKRARTIQIGTHLFLRLILPLIYLKSVFNLKDKILVFNLYSIYLVGFLWMYKLITSYLKDYNNEKLKYF